MSDVDKSVPIPKPAESKKKWFGDDQQTRNKVLSFSSKWHSEEPQPPSLSTADIVKINEMIADGKDPQLTLQQPDKSPTQDTKNLDPLSATLAGLGMKKVHGRFVKDREEE